MVDQSMKRGAQPWLLLFMAIKNVISSFHLPLYIHHLCVA